jgi:uncharacterized protein YyaL (SSP411 family)
MDTASETSFKTVAHRSAMHMSVEFIQTSSTSQRHAGGWACWGMYLAFILPTSLSAQDVDKSKQEVDRVHRHTNALIDADSPYLLQHAHNPVNWLPWGPAAFAKAKAENKPIFVSIGYSTCYWCHVMERESFENETIAAIINEHYIAIKVDREERPDIDEQMMLATQLLTGRGGWPTSVWLTCDGRPWMAGTYFPPTQFTAALKELARIWRDEAEAVEKQAASLTAAIRQTAAASTGKDTTLDTSTQGAMDAGLRPLKVAVDELVQIFDEQYAGFGSQPKFPPHGPLRLLAQAVRHIEAQPATAMLVKTLQALYRGGIHDHIGGGYHRYSTDSRWLVPHFEKMLYDNAQLLRSFSEAYELTGDEFFRSAAQDIVDWVDREMTHPQGGFFSALDSESDGEEGRFYTWSMDELSQVLNSEEVELFARAYNFQKAGNFTEEATGERPGTNIPFLSNPPPMLDPQSWSSLESLRGRLLKARDTRSYPRLDDKVLTSWNGLMISSLAHASRIFKEPEWESTATRGADFVLSELQPDGHLLHTWRNGSTSIAGYLDDYAFLCEGLVELYQATDDQRWLVEAQRLADIMLELFEDREQGGFYFTSSQHEQLLMRSKNLVGGGNLPNGNGIAIQTLLRLYTATGRPEYLRSARRGLDAFAEMATKAPRQIEHIVLAYGQLADIDSAMSAVGQSPVPGTAQALQADDLQRSEVITAELFLSHAQRAAGETCHVAVRIGIVDGYHLYGLSPLPDAPQVQATTIRWVSQPQLRAGKLVVPKGVQHQDPVLGGAVSMYTDEIWFYLPIEVNSQSKPAEYTLQVEVHYQACDRSRCLAPSTLVLSAPLTICSERDTAGKHNGVFTRMPE